MQIHRILKTLVLIAAFIPFVEGASQTRFQRPDTSPDYSSYRHLDECIYAINRLKDLAVATDPVWQDTVSLDTLKLHRPLPESVVTYAKACLEKIDVDTIPLKDTRKYASALLVANRDVDVGRMYTRLADSIRNDSTREAFVSMLTVYLNAVPVRIENVMSLYEMGLMQLPRDSVTTGLVLRSMVASATARSGDHRMADRIAREILSITDTLSERHRDEDYRSKAEALVYPIVSGLMPQEARDSLSKSTEAYREYLARLWKSIVGYDADTEIGPIGKKSPQPTGHFWYSNSGGDGAIRVVDSTGPIEQGRVNAIYFVQAGCHSRYESVTLGRLNGHANTCWPEVHRLRKLQKRYPQIKLTIVSNTFGTFADAPPLEPRQEADTLADYFLNFHGLKGIQVVYNTEYIRLAGYDNRRVDNETDNHLAFRFGNYSLAAAYNNVVFIDEAGLIFHIGKLSDMSEYIANARIESVMSRPANQR